MKTNLKSNSLITPSFNDLPVPLTVDKAGKVYWDRTYECGNLPRAANPRDKGLKNFVERQFLRHFSNVIGSMCGKQLLEIGCGGSQYLPYFSKELGMHVAGIDYSQSGCDMASAILAREGVTGQIYCADLFDPPSSLHERFDVVISMGVVEHFADTAAAVAAIARFANPGGLVLTFVPNLNGLTGFLQRLIDRAVFDKHIPLDTAQLRRAHELSGLLVEHCDYFIFNSFFVANINEIPKGTVEWQTKATLLQVLHYVSGAIWALETIAGPFHANRLTSPFIACAARTKASKVQPEP